MLRIVSAQLMFNIGLMYVLSQTDIILLISHTIVETSISTASVKLQIIVLL